MPPPSASDASTKRRIHRAAGRAAPPLLAGCLLLALWYATKAAFGIHDFLLPAPHHVATAFWNEGRLLAHAAAVTAIGALLGFSCALLCGVGAALLLASLRTLRNALYPYILFLQMSPLLATAAIVVILFGTGLPSVVLISFLICFFPILASTLQGLRSTPKPQLDLFTLYRATPLRTLFWLRLPYALPWLFNGTKIAATLAVIGAVTGEIFAGSSTHAGGLGFLILIYKAELKTAPIYAATLICCAMGFAFVASVQALRHRFLRNWHDSSLPENS